MIERRLPHGSRGFAFARYHFVTFSPSHLLTFAPATVAAICNAANLSAIDMPQEIEIKVQVKAHDAVRERLIADGAARRERVLETNRLFDNAERALYVAGCGLRLRECRDEHGRAARATLTYKGPKAPGPIKSREEIEFGVEDPEACIALLTALGFKQFLSFEKRRESWQMQECLVELDEVPYLGRFVEIEGPDEAQIRLVQRDLGLGDLPTIAESYIGLLVHHCQLNQLPIESIRF